MLRKIKLFSLLLSLLVNSAVAQSSEKITLVEGADVLEGRTVNGEKINVFKGNNIKFKHKDSFLYCDSAYLYGQSNTMKAFSRVRIVQGDSISVNGDSLTYNGDSGLADLQGEVMMRHRSMTLTSGRLDYDTKQKIAYYYKGAHIKDGKNDLTSEIGFYNTKNKTVYFRHNVMLTNSQFYLFSDTLEYNTNTKISYLRGPTDIETDAGTFMYAESGQYNSKGKTSELRDDAYIENEKYFLEGDTLYYEEKNQLGKGKENVKLTLKQDSLSVSGKFGNYWGLQDSSRFYGDAVISKRLSKDTLFVASDTVMFVGNPEDKAADTLQKRILTWPNTRLFNPDIQGKCDTLIYRYSDSTIYMINDPVLWNKKNQLTADSISMLLVNNKISRAFLKKNSFAVSEDTTGNYNQIKGREMTAFFKNDTLHSVSIDGNAESIYFALKEDTVLVGVDKRTSSEILITFNSGEIYEFISSGEVEGSFLPPKNLTTVDRELPGLQPRFSERPDRESVFRTLSTTVLPPEKSENSKKPTTEEPELPVRKSPLKK